MFDASNIKTWKIRMCSYLKALRLHVYPATTKWSFIDNVKYFVANAQAMIAMKQTLSNDYLSKVANCDFAFAMWFLLHYKVNLKDYNIFLHSHL